jgi:hypothetical protein
MPEAACTQLRRRPPEDEQGNAGNMYRSLINKNFEYQVGDQPMLYYDARSTNHQVDHPLYDCSELNNETGKTNGAHLKRRQLVSKEK